ncbi:MAG: hypothetical protein ACE3JK_12430 [Sporolactobacillus sp.]
MVLATGALLVAIILINQLREKPLTGRLYRQPLALLLFVACALSFMTALSAADWVILSGALIMSFALGLLQGRYTPLIHHDGAWYLSGSLLAVAVWLISIPIRYGLNAIAVHYLSLTPSLTGSSSFIIYFIFIAGFLLGRYTMLFFRYPQLLKNVGRNEKRLGRIHAR